MSNVTRLESAQYSCRVWLLAVFLSVLMHLVLLYSLFTDLNWKNEPDIPAMHVYLLPPIPELIAPNPVTLLTDMQPEQIFMAPIHLPRETEPHVTREKKTVEKQDAARNKSLPEQLNNLPKEHQQRYPGKNCINPEVNLNEELNTEGPEEEGNDRVFCDQG